jgi:hypothetical protein
MLRLIEQRQVLLGEVGDPDLEVVPGPGALDDPVGDGGPDPPRAGATDDDQKDWLGHVSYLLAQHRETQLKKWSLRPYPSGNPVSSARLGLVDRD